MFIQETAPNTSSRSEQTNTARRQYTTVSWNVQRRSLIPIFCRKKLAWH